MLHVCCTELGVEMAKGQHGRRSFGRLRKLPSGRWQAAYTHHEALFKAPVTFEDRDAAGAWLAAERRLIDLGEWQPPEKRVHRARVTVTRFGPFADEWLEDRPLKPRTRAHYRNILDKHLAPTFADRPLAAITHADVQAWYRDMGVRTPTLRSHAYGLLRTILGSAVESGHITTNPCHIRGAGSSKRVHRVEPMTLSEVEAATRAMPDKYQLMVLLAAWCALRFGELAELRRRDLDLSNARLRIRRGVVRVNGVTIVGSPKTDAGIRDVAIPPHLVPALREHLDKFSQVGRDGLVFPAANGGNLAPSTFYGKRPIKVERDDGSIEYRGGTCWYRARAVAGRPDMHFHDLRHTGAVLAAQTGATLAELMSRLGHSTPGAAMRYQHAARDRDAVIAAALSRMASGPRDASPSQR